ncbi:MAG: GNAT family N-acetyltransferase [Candidatus Cloacimonas sp.]|nr:GNAT family N-acetyltransferase [Candidatus Cloacimonas sp.]MDY0218443.1 GNAT family N-acetyltransferase [Candidatus Cloacimonas acidaminovorans]
MADYEILTISDIEKWNQYLSMLPVEQQDVYFTPEYYKLYENNGDGIAYCFVFKDHNNLALYPFLMNRINDLGYDLDDEYYDIQGAYGYNGVAYSSNNKEFVKDFYENYYEFIKTNKVVCEFIRFHPLLKNEEFSLAYYNIIFDRKTVFLALDSNDVYNGYNKQTKKKIRRSEREGIKIRIGDTQQDIIDFMHIYYHTMNYLQAKDYYYFPESYFFNFHNYMDNMSKLIVAELNGKVIGGMMYMIKGLYAHNHLSAADVSLRNMGVNIKIQHFVILDAIKEKCRFIHLGGGRTNNPDDSLLRFKENFSSYKADFKIAKKIYIQNIYEKILVQWKEKYPLAASNYPYKLQGYRHQF